MLARPATDWLEFTKHKTNRRKRKPRHGGGFITHYVCLGNHLWFPILKEPLTLLAELWKSRLIEKTTKNKRKKPRKKHKNKQKNIRKIKINKNEKIRIKSKKQRVIRKTTTKTRFKKPPWKTFNHIFWLFSFTYSPRIPLIINVTVCHINFSL